MLFPNLHGNLRYPPQSYPPRKYGLIKGLLTTGFPWNSHEITEQANLLIWMEWIWCRCCFLWGRIRLRHFGADRQTNAPLYFGGGGQRPLVHEMGCTVDSYITHITMRIYIYCILLIFYMLYVYLHKIPIGCMGRLCIFALFSIPRHPGPPRVVRCLGLYRDCSKELLRIPASLLTNKDFIECH